MKALIITNLFPNNRQPVRGLFNKQQFRELAKLCALRVIAPVPWIPGIGVNGERAMYRDVEREELVEDKIQVYHPRYLVIPKIGRSLYGILYYAGIIGIAKKIYKQFAFDVIFATWAYPDAFAAALVAKALKKPLVIKVHGTDINVLSRYWLRRKMMTFAFRRAEKIIAVSRALKKKIVEMGIAPEKIEVLLNGIDTGLFKKMDKKECQAKVALPSDKRQVVFIGNLVAIKGIDYLIEAFNLLPDNIDLNIIGEGELRGPISRRISELKLNENIHLRGRCAHSEIPTWLNAADLFCLPSLNEGCPNVVLEAMACGTPVVASEVGAIPDMVVNKKIGTLVRPADAQALASAIDEMINRPQNGSHLKESSKILSWRKNAEKVMQIIERVS